MRSLLLFAAPELELEDDDEEEEELLDDAPFVPGAPFVATPFVPAPFVPFVTHQAQPCYSFPQVAHAGQFFVSRGGIFPNVRITIASRSSKSEHAIRTTFILFVV